MFMSTPARALLAPSIDPDAAAWRHAVIAAGGLVSSLQQQRVTKLIRSLKACGAWALTDDYAVYAAENQTQALVTLKKRQTQTLAHIISTNPTFVANRGFLGNRDGYVSTSWNPTTGTNYTQNNARFGAWVYSAAATYATYAIGADNDVDNTSLSLRSNGFLAGVNSVSVCNYNTAGGAVSGWLTAERADANGQTAYQNGIQVAVNLTATSAVPQNVTFRVLADNGGGASGPTDAGISAALYGAALGTVQRVTEYAALRTYLTSVGVP
jgi:hypothetical protein